MKLFKKLISIFKKPKPVKPSPTVNMMQNEVVANVSMILHDDWVTLTGLYRINPSFDYWVSFITALCFVESGYNPNCVFMEPAPLFYESVGLLQLSNEDFKTYGYPKIDLKDPYQNLKFGIYILNKMAKKHGHVIFEGTGQYWSTLRPHKNKKQHEKFLAKLEQIILL